MTQKVIEYYPEPRKNLPAHPDSWKKEPLPTRHSSFSLDRTFSAEQIKKIQHGYVPEEMEDKWFIYWEKDTLSFHRSWTGYCVYIVHFTPEGDGYKMVQAEANREPEQYTETSDARDAAMISYLIDLLLLGQPAEFPSDEANPEKRALMNWSMVGRAMIDEAEEESTTENTESTENKD